MSYMDTSMDLSDYQEGKIGDMGSNFTEQNAFGFDERISSYLNTTNRSTTEAPMYGTGRESNIDDLVKTMHQELGSHNITTEPSPTTTLFSTVQTNFTEDPYVHIRNATLPDVTETITTAQSIIPSKPFDKLIENVRTATEQPLFASTTETISTTTEKVLFGLDTPVDVNSFKLPFSKTTESSSMSTHLKDMLNSMRDSSTKIDPSIFEPVSPMTHYSETPMAESITHTSVASEGPLFTLPSTTESPININMNINSVLNTTLEDILGSTTEKANTTILQQTEKVTEFTNVVSDKITTLADEFTFTPTEMTLSDTTTVATEITTAASEITDKITSASSEITFASSEMTFGSSEVTSAASEIASEVTSSSFEITSAASDITSAVSEISSSATRITTGAFDITTDAYDVASSPEVSHVTNEVLTTVANEITSAANEITTVASEITNVAKNITSVWEGTTEVDYTTRISTEISTTLTNLTQDVVKGGGLSPDSTETNSWVFYVIVGVTIGILLVVVGGSFIFYKRIKKGGKGSGYQVSQMKEYSSSSGSDNDVINAKV